MPHSPKQLARLRAAQQFQKRREEHLARENRIRDLVVEATTALLEKERVVALADQRIGAALRHLEELSVPTAEAAALCGLEPRELTKFRNIPREDQ